MGCTALKLSSGGETADLRSTGPGLCGRTDKEFPILYYALVFLIVGLVASALGLVGVAGIASEIAWILFLIGIVLLVVQLFRGRTPPVTQVFYRTAKEALMDKRDDAHEQHTEKVYNGDDTRL